MPTSKVLGGIKDKWKRTFTNTDKERTIYCSVCLEEFVKGEEVIELHCGKGHIFHPNCIHDWAQRNKSCPLWRKDFVSLAREEEKDQKATYDTRNRMNEDFMLSMPVESPQGIPGGHVYGLPDEQIHQQRIDDIRLEESMSSVPEEQEI
jgi:hypothetical protein